MPPETRKADVADRFPVGRLGGRRGAALRHSCSRPLAPRQARRAASFFRSRNRAERGRQAPMPPAWSAALRRAALADSRWMVPLSRELIVDLLRGPDARQAGR